MANPGPLVLLGGTTAMDLALRLEASGYRTGALSQFNEPGQTEEQTPAAVILSPAMQQQIPELRRRWGALPILLGTPHDNVEGRYTALGSGADDLWITSAGPSDLLSRLRLHLQLVQSARQESSLPILGGPIVMGDLEVDPHHQIVHRRGLSLDLTNREFQLLMLLLRHSPKVVGREHILREIWPEERASTSNVIEVYVRYLRRKLEAGHLPRLIHTVRGLGYCLRE